MKGNCNLKYNLLAVLLVLTIGINAQDGVRFMNGGISSIKKLAEEQNKNILIDTYASWCIPCKRMDKVFARKDVGDFYNKNYINLKVNMDGPYGALVKSEFQVVFLPTIIIVGPDGRVKYKVDREMSAQELLSVGELALKENIEIESDGTRVRKNGDPKLSTKSNAIRRPSQPSSSANDKIVYVLGVDALDEPNADFLRKEAYFRVELMDGSHYATAERYLETQTDWNTRENMRFILNFVSVPDSPMYNHVIANKAAYYEAFTKAKVDEALQILVYRHLYKGIPRPDMSDAINLFADLGYPDPTPLAEKYFMVRYKIDRQHQKAFDISYNYMTITAPDDKPNLVKFLDYVSDNAHQFDSSQINKVVDLMVTKLTSAEEKSLYAGKIKRLKEKAN